ncbi:MAG: hypothetical protein ABR511_03410 [Acidimicrobiales bacterium]
MNGQDLNGESGTDKRNSAWCTSYRHPSRWNQCRIARRDAKWAGNAAYDESFILVRNPRFAQFRREGIQNAVRHCAWSASMTMDLGEHDARGFLGRHEEPGDVSHDHFADLHNNDVGVSIGQNSHSRAEILRSCSGNSSLDYTGG